MKVRYSSTLILPVSPFWVWITWNLLNIGKVMFISIMKQVKIWLLNRKVMVHVHEICMLKNNIAVH